MLDFVAWGAAAGFSARTLAVTARSGEQISVAQPSTWPILSIIVPARNEEHQIEQCVRSLLAQEYRYFEVIVVDDRSDDGTARILRELARSDTRLRIVDGEPLPEGWVGKPWALQQGSRSARGEWLLFTDADTLHHPQAASSALDYALLHDLRALSLLPTQRFETVGERVLLPTILWMIAFGVGSLQAINDPKRKDAAIFNGQYLLFERRAYDALGGHAAVRGYIAEDYEFARLVKSDGRFPANLVGAGGLVSTRMYRSAREIWRGFSKNLYVAAEDHPLGALAGSAMLAALSILPPIQLTRALMKGRYARAAGLAAGMVATMAAAEVAMRRSRFPRGSGAFLPIGAGAMLAIFLNSALAHRTGRVSWRGRRYIRRTTRGEAQTAAAYGHADPRATTSIDG